MTLSSNKNFFYSNKFDVAIKRLPNVLFDTQTVTIPSISLEGGVVQQTNMYTTIPYASEKTVFGNMSFTFALDEDMSGWLEIYEWLKAIGRVEDSNGYLLLEKTTDPSSGLKSDMTVTMMNSRHRPNVEFEFVDAFPVALSGFDVSTVNTDIVPVYINVTMSYTIFRVRKVTP